MEWGYQLNLAGRHGTYKEIPNIPFKAKPNTNCTACGIYADGCPVGVIAKTIPAIPIKKPA